MTIQPKVAKKTIETLNDFYGHVYRLSPVIMFLVLLIILIINGVIKYSHTKNILDSIYLEIPFVFLKKLFGLEHEFDYLMLSKKERKKANTLTAIRNIYKKYVEKKFDLNKPETVAANIDLLIDADKSLENFTKNVFDKYFNSKNEKDSSDHMKAETGETSVNLIVKLDKILDKPHNKAMLEATDDEDNQAVDEVNQAIVSENQEIDIKNQNKVKDTKFLKLYLQFVVHFFFAVISFLILLLQILIPIHEIENECKPGYSCFKLLNKTRESFNCSSISSEEKNKYVCQKHELETFSEFLTDIGAFSGLVALIFNMHSYTLSIFIYVKTKLRTVCRSKSCNISYKCGIVHYTFYLLIFLEILFLIFLLLYHAISEQFIIEILEEEYLVHGGLFISLLLTTNLIEKRLFKANLNSKFEIPSDACDAVKSLIKTNFMKNATDLFD